MKKDFAEMTTEELSALFSSNFSSFKEFMEALEVILQRTTEICKKYGVEIDIIDILEKE